MAIENGEVQHVVFVFGWALAAIIEPTPSVAALGRDAEPLCGRYIDALDGPRGRWISEDLSPALPLRKHTLAL